jgi:histidinol dehydrogenase
MIPIFAPDSPEGRAFRVKMSERGGFGDESLIGYVREIIANVRRGGDVVALDYTRRFDSPDAEALNVSTEDIERAYAHVSGAFLDAIRLAIANVRRFHEKQLRQSWMTAEPDGVVLGQYVHPLGRVGVYAPPRLYSSLIMNAIPARVAGVEDVVLAVPPQRNGRVHPGMLVTARECGIGEVYACAGVPAIAAMAYGTPTMRRVDKIVGPGGDYVQLAKREVVGVVDIDKLAGPSEILVIADDSATPSYIAADLISQAEHGRRSSAVLVTTSRDVADAVCAELERQTPPLPRADEVRAAFANYGAAFLVESVDDAVRLANEIAPEHVELHTRDAFALASRIHHAGAVFVGSMSPEAVGDYVAGPSHVLPTGGTARFYSAASVGDFTKTTNLIAYTSEALDRVADAVVTLANAEGLDGHGVAVTARRTCP